MALSHPLDTMTAQAVRPSRAVIAKLRPENRLGALHISLAVFAAGLGLTFSLSASVPLWIFGQLLLAIAFLNAFALLHEAGHKTLFRSARANAWAGHFVGCVALIPFHNWRLVHMRHHFWTGWHDLDPTTSSTLPRPMPLWERLAVNVAWAAWLPLFSIVYRVQNYWWLPRLWGQFKRTLHRRRLVFNTVGCLAVYAGLACWLGPIGVLKAFGLALWVSFAVQDVILLSQHSHIPMEHSGGETVDAFAPLEQERFTRSLAFPEWFSRFVLLRLDAHELHHMYPSVPGYHLHRIDYRPPNTVAWWRWIVAAKRVPGVVLLFQNQHETGWDL